VNARRKTRLIECRAEVALPHTFFALALSLPFLLAFVAPGHGPSDSNLGPWELWSLRSLISLATLASLEIVLGIDNVIFIAILAGKLPKDEQPKARRLGISMAVITRILLLLSITWVMRLTTPLFTVAGFSLSGKSLILLLGGLFLIGKSTFEIHDKLEGSEHEISVKSRASLGAVVAQIMVIDIVFSLDSVITAVGMTPHVPIMIVAVILAAAVMLMFAGPISDFVARHPTMKMLALSFLILIGVMLVAEGLGQHIDKGYIYFAMAFSVIVEMLNIRLRKKSQPVPLRHSTLPESAE
jgi:predicted tellurium resistance membrane protein TerC